MRAFLDNMPHLKIRLGNPEISIAFEWYPKWIIYSLFFIYFLFYFNFILILFLYLIIYLFIICLF